MAIALHHSEATGSAKVVLLGIANHDGDGGSYPSVETLAKYARFKGWDAEPLDDSKEAKRAADKQRDNAKKSAREAVRKLEAMGEIEVIVNGGGSARTPHHERPNLHIIKLKCPANCDRSAQHRIVDAEVVDNSESDPRGHSPAPGPQPRTPRGHSPAEPSLNHPPMGNSGTTPRESRGDDRETDSADVVDEYASWSPGQKIAEAARRAAEAEAQHKPIKRPDLSRGSGSRSMVPPAPKPPKFDPASVPPKPPPRSPEEDDAVAALMLAARCPARHDAEHLIPATSTICLRCGADAVAATGADRPQPAHQHGDEEQTGPPLE